MIWLYASIAIGLVTSVAFGLRKRELKTSKQRTTEMMENLMKDAIPPKDYMGGNYKLKLRKDTYAKDLHFAK